jgi:hypothetical protein
MLAEVGADGKTRYRYTKRAGQKKGKRDEDGPKEEKVRVPRVPRSRWLASRGQLRFSEGPI